MFTKRELNTILKAYKPISCITSNFDWQTVYANELNTDTITIYNKLLNDKKSTLSLVIFKCDNTLHRETGPAYIEFYDNGKIREASYYYNGKLHSYNNIPSCTYYNPNGKIAIEKWHINGKLENQYNPAFICYNKKGKIISREWWLNDLLISYTQEEFNTYVFEHKEEYLQAYNRILKENSTTIFD